MWGIAAPQNVFGWWGFNEGNAKRSTSELIKPKPGSYIQRKRWVNKLRGRSGDWSMFACSNMINTHHAAIWPLVS